MRNTNLIKAWTLANLIRIVLRRARIYPDYFQGAIWEEYKKEIP
jgi:hypothetical protein